MGNLVLAFGAIVATTSALGLFGLMRMASSCSRDEDFDRAAVRFASVTADVEPMTLALSLAA